MRICIHQPQFIPYLGFYAKAAAADRYIVLDDVQAIRQDYTNRNRVKSPAGEFWLTVPVAGKRVNVMDMEISAVENWTDRHLKNIRSFYGKAPYYDEYFPAVQELYLREQWIDVTAMDMAFLAWTFEILNLNLPMQRSSEMQVTAAQNERLVGLCRRAGAKVYVAGTGSKAYMNEDLFRQHGVTVRYIGFTAAPYPQRFGQFIPNLSVLDALFNCGAEKVKNMIQGDIQ